MTVFEKIGSKICCFLCVWCLRLGFVELAKTIYNYAQIHYLKVPPTHFCKYHVVYEDGEYIVRCRSCGKVARPPMVR